MADKSVGELIAAKSVTPTDLFVLEQNGTAKKLTGQTLENWLVSFADGHGGIQSIVKESTSGLVDTYRITLADTTTFDFVVTNGRSVNSIAKTAASGLVDTYTIKYNDGTTSTFTVTNGAKGDKGDNAYMWIKYASQEPTASSNSFGDLPDDWIGVYFGTASTAPTDWQQYAWYKIKGEQGETGDPATLTTAIVTYQVGDSGTIIPSGTWSTTIPVVAQGKYLWTRQVIQFNTGDPITTYSVARFGIDGAGSVSSVAGISPDENGNVSLTASDVKALPITGGDMEGPINMNGQRITGLNTPTQSNEVATKGYVDNAKPNMTGYATETYVNNAVGAKVDKEEVVNNFTTTVAGYVADARALKTLNDSKLSMELLWENASPSSDFNPQIITVIDITVYDLLLIVTSASSNFAYAEVGGNFYLSHVGVNDTYNQGIVYSRPFSIVSATTIQVDNCQRYEIKSDEREVYNKQIKPLRIYGIKGVSA